MDPREDERYRIADWLRTPITGLESVLTLSELIKFRVLLDMTADMIENDDLRVKADE